MLVTYQYRVYPTAEQKLRLNKTRRICQYLYNRLLGERFDWWENNRCYVNSCPLWSCALPQLKDQPDQMSQQSLLPLLKKDLVLVEWSGELLDLSTIYSQVLQNVVHRVDQAFKRYIQGDSKGKKSGKPRFKSEARYRSFTYTQAKNDWLQGDYINLPKIGLIKIRYHRPIPSSFTVKTCQIIKKADGWYINLALEDKSVPDFTPDEIKPSCDNSLGIDMGLEKFLTASSGEIVPIYQPLRLNQEKLTKISEKKNKRKKGSKKRRQLAKKEAKLHQKIAKTRRDNHFKVASQLVDKDTKVFFVEDLNLKGLIKRNKPKQDEQGNYIPNHQSQKSGLNKSFCDAGIGQFLDILSYKAENAGKRVVRVNPNYTSQICCQCDAHVPKTLSDRIHSCDCGLEIDRDWNASLNIKRVGLDVFPTIKKCRKGKDKGIRIISEPTSTLKEILELPRSQHHTD